MYLFSPLLLNHHHIFIFVYLLRLIMKAGKNENNSAAVYVRSFLTVDNLLPFINSICDQVNKWDVPNLLDSSR